MKKFLLLSFTILFALASMLRADEGMWLLPLLKKMNIDKMQEMGLQLTAEDIYSINHSSLKDAVVIFGGGCTGEIVSSQGLLLTNHHCGYEAIQSHSTVEHDYLKDGFWAMSKAEEIPTPGLSVTFLIRMEDVTSRVVVDSIADFSEKERNNVINRASELIVKEVKDTSHYEAIVRSFFGGNKYYLLVYEIYNDVRLVGAPPSSIGKFGGDTDNWMWPRHTGDFSVFRVYMTPDGKPAEYSTENIPLNPKYYFPVSLAGYQPDSFAMIIGNPGGTDRYMTSWEVQEQLNIIHPNRIKIRGVKQDIMLEDMDQSDEVRIKYASKYSRSSNYWKFSIGQARGIENLKIVDEKTNLQNEFTKWLDQNSDEKANYGEALNLIQQSIQSRAPYENATQYIDEAFFRGVDVILFALRNKGLNEIVTNKDKSQDEKNEMIIKVRNNAEKFYKDYNPPTDKKIMVAMLKLFDEGVADSLKPSFFRVINKKYKGNYQKYVDDVFSKSIFPYKEKYMAFLAEPNAKTLQKDPLIAISNDIYSTYNYLLGKRSSFDTNFEKGHRKYIAGVLEMKPQTAFYPDANFTMRLTYGTVQPYWPRDAVFYNYYTTLKGVSEKEDPENDEFVVPEKLKSLYETKDYGRYAENGKLITCFITTNDITGGNSGSPVLNGKGELIGIAFDGNWEAMTGDIAFENDLQRCINVDIRYVLFIMDKYAGAKHLVDEMTLVQ